MHYIVPDIPVLFAKRIKTGGVNGMSVKQKGSFFGYSIELSVANQFCKWSFAKDCESTTTD